MSTSAAATASPARQLSKDELHTYAKAMMTAMETPEFQTRVRAAMSRAPVPSNTETVMDRYEEVQAEYFTNHYTPAEAELSAKVAAMDLEESEKQEEGEESKTAAAPADKLDGAAIMAQLRNAVNVYKDSETERTITQLCLLVEAKVMALPATVPELKHLYVESVHGRDAAGATAAARASGGEQMPIVNPSPEMMSMMEMAMKTLTPTQRATLERAQTTMMRGSPPSPEDMRDMFMIQRQLGAFMATMQQFGQAPGGRGGRGRGGGMRGGGARGGRGK